MNQKTVESVSGDVQVTRVGGLCKVTLRDYVDRVAALYLPPHKLRAFGRACIQIADEVRDGK